MICHYWFFRHRFKFQHYLCNGCHDLRRLRVTISDTAIITIKGIDYHCIIHVNKSEAINLLENSLLEDCSYIQNDPTIVILPI